MELINNLLGGGGDNASSTDLSSVLGTNPQFGLQASDILHSESHDGNGGDSSSFTGIGDLGVGFAAPTVVGVDFSQDQVSQDNGNSGGGLLGGLI